MSPGPGEMVWSVKCLPHKHKDLRFYPEHLHKKPGTPALISALRSQRRKDPHSKIKWTVITEDTHNYPCAHTHQKLFLSSVASIMSSFCSPFHFLTRLWHPIFETWNIFLSCGHGKLKNKWNERKKEKAQSNPVNLIIFKQWMNYSSWITHIHVLWLRNCIFRDPVILSICMKVAPWAGDIA